MSQPIDPSALNQFVSQLLIAQGVDYHEANIIAPILIWFDLIGRPLQGLGRLPDYLKRLEKGLIQSPCQPKPRKQAAAIMLLDGQHGFGHYIGHVAMQNAIALAQQTGVGVVAVKNSNHFGAAAYYVNQAAQAQMLGLAMSNAPAKVVAFGGLTRVFGTNPIAFAAPTSTQNILVDFSTGASAGSTVTQAAQEGKPIPPGIFIDAQGQTITDATQSPKGAMLPFGGAKGFCLGLMVEILSGVITSSAISPNVASLYQDFERYAQTGHFFMALNIGKFMPMPSYFERMDTLITIIKTSQLQPGFDEILLPGETRWRHYQHYQQHGLPLSQKTRQTLDQLAQAHDLATPW